MNPASGPAPQDVPRGPLGAAALDPIDAALIDALQDGIAPIERPFDAVAGALELDPALVVERLRALLAAGVLSRFGPMFDADRFGGAMTLAAIAAPPERFDEVCEQVNAFEEVAHNYARAHRYNMWFVVVAETPALRDAAVEAIARRTGLPVLDLPKEVEYFVGLRFDVANGRAGRIARARGTGRGMGSGSSFGPGSGAIADLSTSVGPDAGATTDAAAATGAGAATDAAAAGAGADPGSNVLGPQSSSRLALDEVDRAIVVASQAGLPLDERPFAALAGRVGLPEPALRARVARMLDAGVIRRIAAVPNHYRLGFVANGMTVWDIDDADIGEAGPQVGALPFVTHCYRRPRRLPDWRFNLFAMVHGRDRDEVERNRRAIGVLVGPRARAADVLYSTRVLKKTGLRLAARRPD